MNRREFGVVTMGGVAVAALGMEGCTPAGVWGELETWVPVGLAAFDGVAAIVDTIFAAVATTVDALWAAVENAVNLYMHTTDPTTTQLDKVIAALDALSGGLSQALAALPVSIPAAVLTAAKLGLSLLIATLKSIQAKLEPASATRKAAVAPVNGQVAATSTKDFVNKFNAIMIANGQTLRVK